MEPPPGDPGPRNYLDISRLHEDNGDQPEYDTERATADYITWLRAGNQR